MKKLKEIYSIKSMKKEEKQRGENYCEESYDVVMGDDNKYKMVARKQEPLMELLKIRHN